MKISGLPMPKILIVTWRLFTLIAQATTPLSYRVSDVYIIEQGRDKAIVHFTLTTKLVSGSITFRDNQVTGEMTLRKEDGSWKIYDQKIDNVEYLD